MGAALYLYKKTLKNRAKKAVKKPITYFFVLLILFYVVVMPIGIKVALDQFHWDNPEKLAAFITVMAFWLIPANLISYARRKGLIFRKGDVHFMFPSPVNPKHVLLYAHVKTLLIYSIVGIVVFFAGIFMFHASILQMLLYFILSMGLQNLLEASLMILFYGSEKIHKGTRKILVFVFLGIIAIFFLIAFGMYLQQGLTLESVLAYLDSDWIQMVPLVGWHIGVVHLIFTGPTAVNVIVSLLYLISVGVFTYMAWKMPCNGDYYEEAMKFAEDYEELLQKKQDGQMAFMGQKTKYGKATVTYKSGGAKAIFYKQLLEYKKSKLFFFDTSTLFLLGLGGFLGYVWSRDMMEFKQFILPITLAYLVFCMSAMGGKWSKEIVSPYTFLIPDSPMKKLWYSTLMEHIKSLVCGLIFAIPAGILLDLPLFQVLLSVVYFVCLQACKIYNTVVAEALMGNVLGKVGKQFFVMLLQGITMGLVATAALLGIFLISMEAGYLLMIGVLVVLSFAMMTVANMSFDKMESLD